jgi:cysteinyl-tRNA synthetase
MTVRFFILQAHYRGTLDFSNEALQAAGKGLKRLLQAADDLYAMAGRKAPDCPYGELPKTVAPDTCPAGVSPEVKAVFEGVYDALCDDLNTPVALAQLSEAVRLINSAKAGSVKLSPADLEALCFLFDNIVFGVLGLRSGAAEGGSSKEVIDGLMAMVLEQRAAAKAARDWAASDHIRDALKALGISAKDTKDGVEWTMD